MFVFLTLAILYPNYTLTGFAMATKICRAAKLYQRPLNSLRSLSVLKYRTNGLLSAHAYKADSKKTGA